MLFSCTSIPLNNFLHVVGNTSVPLNPARNWVQHKILSLIFIFKYLRSSNSVFVPPAIPRNRSSLLFISSSGYWSRLNMPSLHFMSSLSSSVIEAMEATESENDLESLTSNNGITGNQIEEQLTISTDEEEESPYEQLRSENIRSRQEQLQSLGISQPIVASFKPVREKKSKPLSTQPIRKSSRIAGLPPGDEAGSVGL